MNENKARSRLDERRAPIYEALERFRQMRVVPFDVPGHKRGRGNPELTAFLGQQCVGVDVNSMKPLDNLCHLLPLHAQRDAQALIHLRVHIHRHRAAQHQRVQHAAVHVAGQNDLIAPLAGGKYHALHAAGGAAHH